MTRGETLTQQHGTGDESPQDLFSHFLAVFVRHWILILSTIAVFVGVASAFLHLAAYKYTAELKLTPVYSTASLPSGLGGLASLAGVNLPGDKAVTPIALYSEALQSRDIAAVVARDQRLMRHLFRREWDASRRQWRKPTGMAESVIEAVKRALGIPIEPWSPPSAADLQKYIIRNVDVIESPRTNITTITVNDVDPEFARALLTSINAAADSHLRQRALRRSSEYIVYIERKLSQTMVTEYRQVLVDALSQQERIRMMASSAAPYSAEPLGAVASSARPTVPNPAVVLGIALVSGLTTGVLLAFARAYVLRRRRRYGLLVVES